MTVMAVTNGIASLTWSAPTLNTDGTPLTNLTGYTIYYGTSQGSLSQSFALTGASTISCEISGLGAGTWYFAVAANVADGSQSAMSNIAAKTI